MKSKHLTNCNLLLFLLCHKSLPNGKVAYSRHEAITIGPPLFWCLENVDVDTFDSYCCCRPFVLLTLTVCPALTQSKSFLEPQTSVCGQYLLKSSHFVHIYSACLLRSLRAVNGQGAGLLVVAHGLLAGPPSHRAATNLRPSHLEHLTSPRNQSKSKPKSRSESYLMSKHLRSPWT